MGFAGVREMLAKTGSIQINAQTSLDHVFAEELIEMMLAATESGGKRRTSCLFPDPDTPVALTPTLTRSVPDEPEGEPKTKKARTDAAGPATAAPEPPAILPAIPVTVLMRPPDEPDGDPWYEGWE
jgi:hypothetical protein